MEVRVTVAEEITNNPIEGAQILVNGENVAWTDPAGEAYINASEGDTIRANWNGQFREVILPDNSYEFVNFGFYPTIVSAGKYLLSGPRLWFVVFILLIALFLIIKKYI
jgi:hypothetical protein